MNEHRVNADCCDLRRMSRNKSRRIAFRWCWYLRPTWLFGLKKEKVHVILHSTCLFSLAKNRRQVPRTYNLQVNLKGSTCSIIMISNNNALQCVANLQHKIYFLPSSPPPRRGLRHLSPWILQLHWRLMPLHCPFQLLHRPQQQQQLLKHGNGTRSLYTLIPSDRTWQAHKVRL